MYENIHKNLKMIRYMYRNIYAEPIPIELIAHICFRTYKPKSYAGRIEDARTFICFQA